MRINSDLLFSIWRSTLGRRKEVARAMRTFYLKPHQVRYGEKDTIDCELGASDVKGVVEDAIDQYSYEEFSKTFDRSSLSPALDEIEATLGSRAFIADCLRISVATLCGRSTQRTSASEIELRPDYRRTRRTADRRMDMNLRDLVLSCEINGIGRRSKCRRTFQEYEISRLTANSRSYRSSRQPLMM